MDSKEKVSAANALIAWFNSQEIGPSDAEAIMQKVLAKILIKSPADTVDLRKIYDTFVAQLANECNDRALHILHGKRK